MILYFKKFTHLLEQPLSTQDVNDINYYLENGWYLQILHDLGIVVTLILIEYFKETEDYMQCDKLFKSIKEVNKHFGTTHPLTLEQYEDLPKL